MTIFDELSEKKCVLVPGHMAEPVLKNVDYDGVYYCDKLLDLVKMAKMAEVRLADIVELEKLTDQLAMALDMCLVDGEIKDGQWRNSIPITSEIRDYGEFVLDQYNERKKK